jgi:putative SOS response-associated peptidase YedK
MLVATYTTEGRRISQIMRWGLIPRWAKDVKIGYSTFNSRADSVPTKPALEARPALSGRDGRFL